MTNGDGSAPTPKAAASDAASTAPEDAAGAEERARGTELAVSFVLRFGILISGAVIVLGLLLFVVKGAGVQGQGIDAKIAFPHSLSQLWAGLCVVDPFAVMSLGLLLIILTPVSRVAVSIFAFIAERDWRYVVITGLVLAILLFSFAIGETGG
ncbi:MAG TPA: DUF1634 domain-containing protein [Rectinemataceae bacterium]|nr:DUF1634 domain-containing protein [Rectinemataceae bacterium]